MTGAGLNPKIVQSEMNAWARGWGTGNGKWGMGCHVEKWSALNFLFPDATPPIFPLF